MLGRYWGRKQRANALLPDDSAAHALIGCSISADSRIGAFSDKFEIAGDHLTVMSAPWSDFRRLRLHFDDLSEDGYPIRPGVSYDLPFRRFFVTGSAVPPDGSFVRPRFQDVDEWARFFVGRNGARATFHPDSQAFLSSLEPRRIRLDAGTFQFLLPGPEGGYSRSQPSPGITLSQMGYRAFTLVNRGPNDVLISDSRDTLVVEQMVLEPDDVLTFEGNDFQGPRSLIVAGTFGSSVLDMFRIQ